MLVGEAWGQEEERTLLPFQGSSGQELNRMLHEAGIMRAECYATNFVNARPPFNDINKWVVVKRKDMTLDMTPLRERFVKPIAAAGFQRLLREINEVRPDLIIALGNTPLWALTGLSGILKWRGSQLYLDVPRHLWPTDCATGPDWKPPRPKLIPTLHPSLILRDWGRRAVVVIDLKRARRHSYPGDYNNVPIWDFKIATEAERTIASLERLLDSAEEGEADTWIDFDIETAAGHIESCAVSWSMTEALTIPFMAPGRPHYWPDAATEARIVHSLYLLLTHRRVKVRWQNGLYDAQYTYRHWHFVPNGAQDTMIAHHSVFCGLEKGLAFQASMYCDHYVYWKDDGKVVDPNTPPEKRWIYNGTDCVRTRENGEALQRTIDDLGLGPVNAFQQEFFWPVLQAMQRGVRVDKALRQRLSTQLLEEIDERQAYFHRVLGHDLNTSSSPQMAKLFYEDLGQRAIYSKAAKGKPSHITCDDGALHEIGLREPLLRPLLRKIAEIRSLRVFHSTFIMAPLDIDGRMRTSYNICGTETFRFSSSANAFGSGTNLQNIPKGGESEDGLELPNIREIFIPDEGFEIFDMDLSKADLRIVAWEADETEMKAMLREGRDPYVESAREFYRDPTITKSRADGSENPKYRTFKSFSHGTHYLGTPYGLAQRLGLTVREAERTQAWYFGRYPKIKEWQKRFCAELAVKRYVQNIFGYRRYYFDRIDEKTCREAIAWLPQSTVALYINRIWMNVYKHYPHIWILLQVHDSLVGQFPRHRRDECMSQLAEASKIVLPYAEPLVIPTGFKTSTRSWGAC